MKTTILITSFLIFLSSCNQKQDKEKLKNEILQAEKAFEKMCAEKGIQEAFSFYADENAVINRGNDSLITGRENIRHFYEKESYKKAIVKWTPDFIDVSESGDLGYTFGKFTWSIENQEGQRSEIKGVFHTVWKRQKDKSWKYVWD